ncbi:MAG: cytochrome c [Bacteroidetes bacterium]|nr:cytochrome c [Rhodothermia bacterium]MCS7155622.1 cytochrome c [Bacteroidota bacterium]MCX7906481.1 cytochrome c [Bacteroidota bacterium]MDW8137238.1 cytochrome c [Bacteroidota bacterium]MDW8284892.1 cytochrome c [Bacteroidota bacterium]
MRRPFAFVFICVLGLGCRSQASDPMLEAGRRLWDENRCWFCHGNDLRGQYPIADRVPLRTDEELKAWIANARALKPGTVMPTYDFLSEAELEQLVAYLRHLAGS